MVIFFQLSWPLPCVEQMFSAQRRDVNKIFEGIPQRVEKRRNTIKTLRNSGDSVDFTTAIIVFGTQSSQKPHAMISNGDSL